MERYDERRRADTLREEEDGKFVAETQSGKLLIGFIVNGVMTVGRVSFLSEKLPHSQEYFSSLVAVA